MNLTGHKALTERGIMNEFFLYDNMKDLAFRIQAIVNNHLDRMVSEKKLSTKEFVMVDWKKYSEVIFDEIVNLTLYGFKPEESKPEVFGIPLTVSHNTQRKANTVSMSRVWNLATGNLFNRWLPGGGALAHKLRNETTRVVSACMATRRSELQGNSMSGTKSDRCPNIFDLYLNHNIRAAKEGRISDIVADGAIIGVLIGTQFAGSDTSQAGSSSGLTYIAEDQKLQQKLLEACKDGNSDQIIENQTMHKLTLEILRLCNPAPGLIPRVAMSNFEINGVKIKKGD
jgi:cytochrome P450